MRCAPPRTPSSSSSSAGTSRWCPRGNGASRENRMKRSALDLSVGIFVLIGLLALGWLSVKLGRVDLLGSRGYVISADFPSVGGLKAGSAIEIAGVEIGRVDKILLQDYQARGVMVIQPGIKLQDDSFASIKTKGLIGERYVRISTHGTDIITAPTDQFALEYTRVDRQVPPTMSCIKHL